MWELNFKNFNPKFKNVFLSLRQSLDLKKLENKVQKKKKKCMDHDVRLVVNLMNFNFFFLFDVLEYFFSCIHILFLFLKVFSWLSIEILQEHVKYLLTRPECFYKFHKNWFEYTSEIILILMVFCQEKCCRGYFDWRYFSGDISPLRRPNNSWDTVVRCRLSPFDRFSAGIRRRCTRTQRSTQKFSTWGVFISGVNFIFSVTCEPPKFVYFPYAYPTTAINLRPDSKISFENFEPPREQLRSH